MHLTLFHMNIVQSKLCLLRTLSVLIYCVLDYGFQYLVNVSYSINFEN